MPVLDPSALQAARSYVKDYWPTLERYRPKDDDSLIGLPKPYLVPAYEAGKEFDFNEMYYWDSYFMIQGIMHDGSRHHQQLAEGMLQNLCYLFERYDVIPTAARTYFTGRSQPPLLSSLIFDIYHAYNKDTAWLKRHMAVAEREYLTVWMGTAKPNRRQVFRGLSRYYNIDVTHDLAEAESGWDYTTRFERRALDYLPIDLNCLLYKYETDLAETARLTGDQPAVRRWKAAAKARKTTINELMWDDEKGLYYDYNYVNLKRSNVSSLAAYYALWSGLANKKQAKQLVRSLSRFETKAGLATTAEPSFNFMQRLNRDGMPTQWAYPNGWAPLHFLTVQGLERYKYHADAKRIATKWLHTNLNWFTKYGVFLEKYNVVEPDQPPAAGVYPTQNGFGWTNAVFERFCHDYLDR